MIKKIKNIRTSFSWKKHPRLWGGLGGLLISFSSFAQIEHGGVPYSFKKQSFEHFATAALPSMDNHQLLQAEMTEERKEDGYQFGKEITVDYRLDNSGTWEDLPNGGRLWRLGIQSKGAYSLNLLFDRFYIPPASNLFIYTADKSFVLGSFTAENNNKWGNFATTLLPGGAIVLEFYEAAQDRDKGILNLSTVVHGYKDFFFKRQKGGQYGTSGACNIDINCPIGDPYQDVKRAVALVLRSNSAHCSGTLINNTAQDTTPYFLTAWHCLRNTSGVPYDPSLFVFIFNYEVEDCEGQNPTTRYSVSGSSLIAEDKMSDFALLLLNDRPPLDRNPYFAGWNRTDSLYEGVVGIHHPRGDWKKISQDRKTIGSGKYFEEDSSYVDNTHYIAAWDRGVTENGSSGSGLFNRDKLLVGQLHGGYAECSNPHGEDYYGKLSYSWTNNNNPDSNRLDYWLDPLGLGVESLEGMDVYCLVNVKDIANQEDRIHVFPNPANSELRITNYELRVEDIALYDMLGRKILNVDVVQNEEVVLNIEKLCAGVYVLKIGMGDGSFVRKIVKR